MTEFDQSSYWRERHSRLVGDPRSVGNLGRSVAENLEAEQRMRRVVDRAARLLRPAVSVLDVGCGYGRIADCFARQGYDYYGIDVAAGAVAEGKRRAPEGTFIVGDLAAWDTDRQFDVVCALYVFVHFVDDHAWESIVTRAAKWVAPGGALLVADHFPSEREPAGQHVVARPLSDYWPLLRERFRVDGDFQAKLIGAGADRLPNGRHFYLFRRYDE